MQLHRWCSCRNRGRVGTGDRMQTLPAAAYCENMLAHIFPAARIAGCSFGCGTHHQKKTPLLMQRCFLLVPRTGIEPMFPP